MISQRLIGPLFYAGTLISSIGSFAFNVSMIAFLQRAGFSLAEVGAILGLQRLIPTAVVGLWGHYTDRISPRKIVLIAEVGAAIATGVLLLLWKGPGSNLILFGAVCIVRATIVTFQIGSRTKITKLLGDGTFKSSSKNAIWFNKATQGATLFGGAIGWVIITNFSLEAAILLDGATFLINGIIALLLPNLEGEAPSSPSRPEKIRQKFADLFSSNPKSAALDLILAAAMMGTVAFQSRFGGNDQSWTAIYMAGFGLAVWIAGFLEQGPSSKISSLPFWITLAASFVCIGTVGQPGVVTAIFFFTKDLSYWILFHRISSHIQADTPVDRMGSVSSARMTLMISILASGEILTGAWSPFVSLFADGLLRGIIAMSATVLLISMRKKHKEAADGRATL